MKPENGKLISITYRFHLPVFRLQSVSVLRDSLGFSGALRFCLVFSEALRFCLENCPPETGWTSVAEGVDITLNTKL